MSKLKQDLIKYKLPLILFIVYYVVMTMIFGYVCPFRAFLHVECPGCGLTRAALYLFKGDLSKSLHYNYTCIPWLIVIILIIIDRYIKPLKIKPFPILFIAASILTLIRYILIVFFDLPIF